MATNKPPTQEQAAPAENKERGVVEFMPFGTQDKIKLTIEIVKRLVAVKTKSGKSCSDEDAFRFMLMCKARRLNPFEGDAYLIGYDSQQGPSFSLITSHQAFLKRAELNPEFDGMDSGTIVLRDGAVIDLVGDWHMPQDNVLGGWATVYFKNRKYPMKKRLRLVRFNKGFGIWKDDPAGMIVKCAEADALRSAFPTMLGGMYVEQEMHPVRPEEIARAVFEETPLPPSNGEPPPPAAAPAAKPAPPAQPAPAATAAAERPTPPPEKAPAPTLQRRATHKTPPPAATAAPSTDDNTDRAKLKSMLAVGGCTPADFVALAIDEGWIDPEQGAWDKIPDARFTEFLKAENWALVMELMDERRSKQATPAAAAPPEPQPKPGQLL